MRLKGEDGSLFKRPLDRLIRSHLMSPRRRLLLKTSFKRRRRSLRWRQDWIANKIYCSRQASETLRRIWHGARSIFIEVGVWQIFLTMKLKDLKTHPFFISNNHLRLSLVVSPLFSKVFLVFYVIYFLYLFAFQLPILLLKYTKIKEIILAADLRPALLKHLNGDLALEIRF